jgi:hypothetical protein
MTPVQNMTPVQIARALAVTAVLVVIIAALARAPYSPPVTGDAVLRLAWRTNTLVREICRPRTPAELEALPVHMRTPEECTRERSEYRLVVAIDGERPDTLRVAGGGLRGDRPVFVMQERLLPAGEHDVRVTFAPWTDHDDALLGPDTATVFGVDTTDALRLSASAALRLDTSLLFVRGHVHLVTLDTEGRRLVVRSPTGP